MRNLKKRKNVSWVRLVCVHCNRHIAKFYSEELEECFIEETDPTYVLFRTVGGDCNLFVDRKMWIIPEETFRDLARNNVRQWLYLTSIIFPSKMIQLRICNPRILICTMWSKLASHCSRSRERWDFKLLDYVREHVRASSTCQPRCVCT